MDISILKWAKIDQLSMRGGGICFEFDAWRMYQRIGIRREYKNECPLVNKKRLENYNLIGKSTINGHFLVAMLVYQTVSFG